MSRNKVFCAALFLVVMLSVFVSPALAVSPSDFTMVTNTPNLNLRSGPGTNYQQLGSYSRGTWLTVQGQSGNWFYVKGPDGLSGYVSSNYTKSGPAAPVTVGTVSNPNPSSFLNFRAAPSYDAQILGIFYNGVPATIISLESGWYYVDVNGVKGYLRNEFITTQTMLASESVSTVTTPNNTALNLRQGPGKDYSVIRQLPGGSYVMVLAQGTGWSKVSFKGYVGFLDNNFLKAGIQHDSDSGSGGSGGGTPSGDEYALVSNPSSGQLLNLRESPNTTARVVGRFKNGTRLTVLAQGSEWCYVQVDKTGQLGYMMTRYLKLYNLPATPMLKVNHPLRSFVNLRKSMSMNSAVLKRVSHGKSITVVVPGQDWYKVKYDGTTGYMVAQFLTTK